MVNFLEELYNQPTLFTNENVFEITYLPSTVKYRDAELKFISAVFFKLIDSPFSTSKKLVIEGPVGVGKTLAAQYFEKILEESAKNRSINLKTIHINCREDKTSFSVLKKVLQKLGEFVPERGYSPQELFLRFKDVLKAKGIYLFLVLDEVDHLKEENFELIYSLSRFNDAEFGAKAYISVLVIVRDVLLLRNLNEATISSLQESVLKFPKYSKENLRNILRERVEKGLKAGVLSEELLQTIVNSIYELGDVRKGLNVIRNAAKYAESKQFKEINLESIRYALNVLVPTIRDDILDYLSGHELLYLLAIIEALRETKKQACKTTEIALIYKKICEQYNQAPRGTTQTWEYAQKLKSESLISIETENSQVKGRFNTISLNEIPLDFLELRVKSRLEKISF